MLSITSCSKDDDEKTPPPLPSEKAKLTNRDFVVTDYVVTIIGSVYTTFSDLLSCQKDDITIFLDDN